MNFIKSIYNHTFDSPLAMANTAFFTIAVIFTFIVIVCEFALLNRDYLNKVIRYIKCFKSAKGARHNAIDIFKYLGEQILICIYAYVIIFFVSLALFIISTVWVEYPCRGTIYTRDGGKWTRHDGRVWHAPFCFDGCTVYYTHALVREGIVGDVFKVKYHIDEKSIISVLNSIGTVSGSLRYNIEDLIETKYKVLIFFTDRKELIDPTTRLKLFQDFYTPFGITIDSVDTL